MTGTVKSVRKIGADRAAAVLSNTNHRLTGDARIFRHFTPILHRVKTLRIKAFVSSQNAKKLQFDE